MSYLSQNDIRITHLGIFIDSLEMRNEELKMKMYEIVLYYSITFE